MDDLQKEWIERWSENVLERPSDVRSPYRRDLARIIHSAAFRRLQGKTQVLGIGEGDFHRTRLTHSVEVAQIGRGIAKALHKRLEKDQSYWEAREWIPSGSLIEAICLAHDLGHPPFGHGGEVALNYSMHKWGGFEDNGQTLRLLSRLEAHTEDYGLDLTRRALLGVLKYPAPYSAVCRKKYPNAKTKAEVKASEWKPPKCFLDTEKDVVDWVLKPFEKEGDREKFQRHEPPTGDKHAGPAERSLDTSIMEIADDIAYGVHDLEDAIALQLISCDDFTDQVKLYDEYWASGVGLPKTFNGLTKELFSGLSHLRKRIIGGIVHALMSSTKFDAGSDYRHPLLHWRAVLEESARAFLGDLKELVVDKVIKTPQVQTLEYRGQQIVMGLFEAFASDPERLMKEGFCSKWQKASSETQQMRVICDYVAGMTDEYATLVYERLFMPRHGTVFERL